MDTSATPNNNCEGPNHEAKRRIRYLEKRNLAERRRKREEKNRLRDEEGQVVIEYASTGDQTVLVTGAPTAGPVMFTHEKRFERFMKRRAQRLKLLMEGRLVQRKVRS